MKIAILTYGEFRTAEIAVKTWNILNSEHDIDIYVHTQTTSNGILITEDNIKKIFSNYKLWLEPIDEFEYDIEPKDIHMNFRSYRFLYKKLLESNIEYDFIIVNRLDTTLRINDINNFFKKNHNGIIYTLDDSINKNRTFVQDHFFMGTGCDIMNFLKNLPTPDNLMNSHEDFGKYILNSGLKNVKNNGVYSIHLRPNMIEFIESIAELSDIDFDKKMHKWFNSGEHKRLEIEWKTYLRHTITHQY